MSLAPPPERIGAAYDGVAESYDRELRASDWIRRALWRHFDGLFRAGNRVLDVGCGTGIDALHLASRGVHVTGVDASGAMLDQFRAKLAGTLLPVPVTILDGDINAVAPALAGGFDGMVSSFAALNTVDLARFAPIAARLLGRQGRLVAHMLAPGYHRGLRAGLAGFWRRPPGEATVRVAAEPLVHTSLTASETYRRFFAEHFVVRGRYGLGVLVPRRLQRHVGGRALDAVARVERSLARFEPLASAGQFFVLDLEVIDR